MLAKLGLTNILGTVTAILTVILGIETQLFHCVAGATDLAASCSSDWLPPQFVALAASLFGLGTFIMKLLRPGGILGSLFGATAVVVPESSPHSTAGTATPEHVAQP